MKKFDEESMEEGGNGVRYGEEEGRDRKWRRELRENEKK